MANIHIPSDANDNGSGISSELIKKKYQQSLAYEQSFLKKKQQLEKTAAQEKLKLEIEITQQIAAAELKRLRETFMSDEERAVKIAEVQKQLAEDLARHGKALAEEQQKAEYQAHLFAADCEMKRFNTLNVHQRELAARQLEATHEDQVAKLRAIKETSIKELEAERAVAKTASEKNRLTRQIKKEKQEIAAAEAEVVKFQQEAAKYSEAVKRVEFERLSAVDKLTTRENEIIELKKKQRAEETRIGMDIEAKSMDLASALASGDSSQAEELQAQISELKKQQSDITASYNSQIDTLSATLEGDNGLRKQAERAKREDPLGSVGTIRKKSDDPVVMLLEDLVNIASSYQSYLIDTSTRAKISSSPEMQGSVSTAPVSAVQLVDSIKKMSVDAAGNTQMQLELNSLVTNLVDLMGENANNEELIEELRNVADSLSDIESEKKPRHQEMVDKWNKDKAEAIEEADAKKAYRQSEEGKKQIKEDTIAKSIENMGNALHSAIADMSRTIDNNIDQFYAYQAEVDAKLVGTSYTYSKSMDKVAKNIGLSMVVSQKEFIQNYKKLVDSGISYNLESRALLETVGNRVINTFNALEPTLLRIIRLQQADSTAARMGMESALNKMFNSYFEDSSYLTDAADSITSAIFEASSQLSRDMSLSFEATVHKWLGSMYSVGFSQETLNKIAQGLNYLGTGNVSSLTSDDSLNVLFALGASQAGLSYADLLNNGLSEDSTNKLLKGMLEYLKTIAENGNPSKVVQSAYSEVFGIGMSDMMALQNLSGTDLESLFGTSLGNSGAMQNVAQEGINSIIKNTHISQIISNLVDNATMAAALEIGDSPALYTLWKATNILESLTGGIDIPFFNVYGFGVDLNTTVEELMKLGITGLSLIGSITSAVGSGGAGALDLVDDWNMRASTTRGTGINYTGAASSGFSQSASISYQSSSSSSDMKSTTMSDAADSAQEDSEIVNKNNPEGAEEIPQQQLEFTKKIYEAVAENDNTVLRQAVKTYDLLADILPNLQLDRLIGGSRVFLTSSVDRLSPSLIQYDSESKALQYKYDVSTLTAAYNVLYDGLDAFDTTSSENFWSEVNAGVNNTSVTHKTNIDRLITTNGGSAQAAKIRDVIGAIAQNQLEAEKVLFPSTVHATLDDVSKKALQLLGQVMLTGGADSTTTGISGTEGETTNPFISQLISALTSATNIVHVAIEEDNTPGGSW